MFTWNEQYETAVKITFRKKKTAFLYMYNTHKRDYNDECITHLLPYISITRTLLYG